jgi:RES domain-containing protein
VIVWRISNYVDLAGQGGLRAPARWHNAGLAIVYTASSPASALVEMLVHLELNDLDSVPDSYRLLMIDVPDGIPIRAVDDETLAPNWRALEDVTRALGDAWLRESSSALLSVPSAIVPHTRNYLINPAHPDARRIKILSHGQYPFDSRLF